MAINKVIRLAGVVLASAAIVAACGSSATPAPTTAPTQAPAAAIKIGVAFPNSDTFLARVQDGMKAEALILDGMRKVLKG